MDTKLAQGMQQTSCDVRNQSTHVPSTSGCASTNFLDPPRVLHHVPGVLAYLMLQRLPCPRLRRPRLQQEHQTSWWACQNGPSFSQHFPPFFLHRILRDQFMVTGRPPGYYPEIS